MNNKTKTIVFASLVAAMIISVSGMNFANAKVQTENTGKLYIKDSYEMAPDTLTEEKRMMIRGHIDALSAVMSETLADGTIPIVSVGTDFKEQSLKVKILKEDFTTEKISLYEKRIRQIVGNDIDITIIPGSVGTYTVCSQTGDCEPLQAGTIMIVEDAIGSCSMGFKASYDGKTGFITAGHCNTNNIGGTGEDVGNPTDTPSDKLGVVHANAFQNNGWCDCLFVDATESISDKVWSNVDVSDTLYPVVTDSVKWEGISSDGTTTILDNYESFTGLLDGNYYTTQGAVEVESEFSPGDSGGPVYEDVSSGTPKFAGTVMGNQDGNGFYVPYYRYTNAFSGLTFTYT